MRPKYHIFNHIHLHHFACSFKSCSSLKSQTEVLKMESRLESLDTDRLNCCAKKGTETFNTTLKNWTYRIWLENTSISSYSSSPVTPRSSTLPQTSICNIIFISLSTKKNCPEHLTSPESPPLFLNHSHP